MPVTIIGMTASELSNRFSGYVDQENLQPLGGQVMARLNAPGIAMGVTNVAVERSAGGVRGVKFTITAPQQLDPTAVKNALR
jgi:hypothetical protein